MPQQNEHSQSNSTASPSPDPASSSPDQGPSSFWDSVKERVKNYYATLALVGLLITIGIGLLPLGKHLMIIDDYPRWSVFIAVLALGVVVIWLDVKRGAAKSEAERAQTKLDKVQTAAKSEAERAQTKLDKVQTELHSLRSELKKPSQRDKQAFEDFRLSYGHGSLFSSNFNTFEPVKHLREEAEALRHLRTKLSNLLFDDVEVAEAHQILLTAVDTLSQWLWLETSPTSGNKDLMAPSYNRVDASGIIRYDHSLEKTLERESLDLLRAVFMQLEHFENVARKQGL